MSIIEGFGAYQRSYYENTVNHRTAKKASGSSKAEKSNKKDEPVRLSEKAKKLLEELKKTYGNMDFIVANYDSDEEAAAYLSRGTKEYSVLIDPETLEQMAADKETKDKYIGILEDSVNQLSNIKSQLADQKDEIKSIGISIDKDGNVSFFAELERAGERQKEFIERSREKRAEERTAEDKKAYEHDRTRRTTVYADSVEELLEQIKSVDWNKIKEEDRRQTGGRFDFSI